MTNVKTNRIQIQSGAPCFAGGQWYIRKRMVGCRNSGGGEISNTKWSRVMDDKIKTSGYGKYKVEHHVLQGDNGTSGKGGWDAVHGSRGDIKYKVEQGGRG